MTEGSDQNIDPPLVRVFVPTYRRPNLLPRALESLLAQTCPRWVAEIHNDDPADAAPGAIVASLADPRITLHQHHGNLGVVRSFNLFFRASGEPFYSLLEDDNWWEPRFLETMLRALQAHPGIVAAWCHQRVWEELSDGGWRDTGLLVGGTTDGHDPCFVRFGDPLQMVGALHSIGAMLVRSRPGEAFSTPPDWPAVKVEALRERMFPHPLMFVPQPLAVFAKTRQSASAVRGMEHASAQTALAATFIAHCGYDDAGLAALLDQARAGLPPRTSVMMMAALAEPRCRRLLRLVRLRDWLVLLRRAARRPRLYWRMLRSRHEHPEWWEVLDRHTAARFAEMRRAASPDLP